MPKAKAPTIRPELRCTDAAGGGPGYAVRRKGLAPGNFSPESLGGGTVRMILTVPDPDAVFAKALAAGSREIFPVEEAHGWRLGRVVDPFGHHWEIGRPLTS